MKIPDLLEIAVAWKRAANPTPEQQAVAEQRIEICDGCEHKKFSKLSMSFICGACGCPLSKKVYSPKPGSEACPEKKWPI